MGAIHASALAVWADDPLSAMKHLTARWTSLTLGDVIRFERRRTMNMFRSLIGRPPRNPTAEAARAWRTEQAIAYPILLDADGAVGRRYGARATPQMFVIDPRGVLRYAGAIDDDPHDRLDRPRNLAAAAADALLAGRPVAQPRTDAYGCSVKYREAAAPRPNP